MILSEGYMIVENIQDFFIVKEYDNTYAVSKQLYKDKDYPVYFFNTRQEAINFIKGKEK